MTNKQIDLEFKKITAEVHDKPQCKTPYPPDVVQTRELLLFAQVELSKILEAKKIKDKKLERFHSELYPKAMKIYYYLKKSYTN